MNAGATNPLIKLGSVRVGRHLSEKERTSHGERLKAPFRSKFIVLDEFL